MEKNEKDIITVDDNGNVIEDVNTSNKDNYHSNSSINDEVLNAAVDQLMCFALKVRRAYKQ